MNFKYIFYTLIITTITSCNNKYNSQIGLSLKTHTKSQIENAKIGDTVDVIIYINDTLSISNNYIIETPHNLYFEAYQDSILIAKNNKNDIQTKQLLDKIDKQIKIIPYNKNNYFVITNKLDLKKHIKFRTIVNEGTYNKLKKIQLWSISTNKIETSDYENFETSNLPIFKIEIDTLLTETKTFATYKLIYNTENRINNITDQPTNLGKIKIKIRGQISKSFPKQSYSITTYSKKNKKQNISLLGMPKEHDWVLYGPFVDYSLIRNVLVYKLYEEMGYYSPKTKFCELVINNDYRGIYILTENIKKSKNRINISKPQLENNDTIKSFIIKLDKGENIVWKSPYNAQIDTGTGKWFSYVYPSPKKMSEIQKKSIEQFVTNFETSLLNNTNWKEYIDINSFVDFLIINELTKNIDAYRLSTYLYKDENSKLKIGPVWDFNFSLGLTNHNDGYKTDGLIFENNIVPFWWKKFIKDDEFKHILKNRWKQLRNSIFSETNLNKQIDFNQNILNEAIDRDFTKWDYIANKNEFRYFAATDHNSEILYIKNWLKNRTLYLDKYFNELK